ncbi:MAG: protein kinase [Micrococcales bacterium]|nr:protein kinase [Micrococcales bacterium]
MSLGASPTVLADRYELGELIGRGGMAEVYLGRDQRLGRTVAIKILLPQLAADPAFVARFQREAQSVAALNHPAIVAIHDTGEERPDDASTAVQYIVTEHVRGQTLGQMLRETSPLPVWQALQVAVGVLTALEHSHQAGIVHRDIKPANVMVTDTGAVKVMDFGIARAVADTSAVTQTLIATPQYLSPEHARGERVDARSDLYSVGCLLLELLTGRPPFVGDTPVAVAVQHIYETPPVPSTLNAELPASLDWIVGKALVKEREGRYQTAAQMRADLTAVIHGQVPPTAAPPGGAGTPTTDPTLGIVVGPTASMPAQTPQTAERPSGPVLGQHADTPSGEVSSGPVPYRHPAPHASYQQPHASYQQPVPATRRRRWPVVTSIAAAALLVVAGAVVVALQMPSGGGEGGTPPVAVGPFVDKITVDELDEPSASDLTRSVEPVSLGRAVEVLDRRGAVSVLSLTGSVRPWIQADRDADQSVITISTDLLFAYASAEIDPSGVVAIRQAVRPAPRGATIQVTGHTDATGGDEVNLPLSQQRAEAVADVIRRERPDLVVEAAGKGSSDPVASERHHDDSDDPDGRAKNRRVEIRFTG